MLEDPATQMHVDQKRENNKQRGNNGREEQNRKTEGRKEVKGEATIDSFTEVLRRTLGAIPEEGRMIRERH